MANNIIEFVLVHDHKCAHEDEQYTHRPVCRAGVYEEVKVMCIEAGMILGTVEVRKA